MYLHRIYSDVVYISINTYPPLCIRLVKVPPSFSFCDKKKSLLMLIFLFVLFLFLGKNLQLMFPFLFSFQRKNPPSFHKERRNKGLFSASKKRSVSRKHFERSKKLRFFPNKNSTSKWIRGRFHTAQMHDTPKMYLVWSYFPGEKQKRKGFPFCLFSIPQQRWFLFCSFIFFSPSPIKEKARPKWNLAPTKRKKKKKKRYIWDK